MAILNDQVKTLPTVCFLDLTVFTNKQTALSGVTTLKYVDLFDELFGSKVEPAVLHFAQATRTNRLVTSTPVVYRWRDEGVWRTGTDLSRTFGTLGDYTLEIAGSDEYFVLEAGPDIRFVGSSTLPVYTEDQPSSQLTHIETWGTTSLKQFMLRSEVLVSVPDWLPEAVTDLDSAFLMCRTFNDPNVSNWDTSRVTSLNGTFLSCRAFNQSLNAWDVSNVTTLAGTFFDCNVFNQPLDTWQTSKVTTLLDTFRNCYVFNQPIGMWDVSQVEKMTYTFTNARAFNQPLNDWDTSSLTDLGATFHYAYAFNQPLDKWDTSKVTTLSYTFSNCLVFNQNLNTWDVSQVQNFRYCFHKNEKFNQPLDRWDVTKGSNFEGMFNEAKLFNQPLNTWNTSNAVSMALMFRLAESFDQPLDNWYTGKVTTMDLMFQNALVFNQPLNSWNVSKVDNFNRMFYNAERFNQPLDNWATDSATTMEYMFYGAKVFNQNLSMWCVKGIPTRPTNFDALATAWVKPRPVWGVCPDQATFVFANATNTGPLTSTGPVTYKWSHEATSKTGVLAAVTFPSTGTYTLTISAGAGVGVVLGTTVNNAPQARSTCTEIVSYGKVGLSYVMACADKLTKVPAWIPKTFIHLTNAFMGCSVLNDPNVQWWDTSRIASLQRTFFDCFEFNQPVGEWDTSNVTNMAYTFCHAYKFNQPLTNWTTGKVVSIGGMFEGAYVFNHPIGHWDIRNITSLGSMLYNAMAFNQDLSTWDFSKVNSLYRFLHGAKAFNQPVNTWDVSNVTNMEYTFKECTSFNQPMHLWKVSNVTTFREMFYGAKVFNRPINNWEVTGATVFNRMFMGASAFNQPLDGWVMTNAKDVSRMFANCRALQAGMETWDVTGIEDFTYMYSGATVFNADLTAWEVEHIPTEPEGFSDETPAWGATRKPRWGIGPAVLLIAPLSGSVRVSLTEGSVLAKWEDEPSYQLITGSLISTPSSTPKRLYLKRAPGSAPNSVAVYASLCTEVINFGLGVLKSIELEERLTSVAAVFDPGIEYFKIDSSTFNDPNVSQWVTTGLRGFKFNRCRAFNQPLTNWDVSNVTSFEGAFNACENFNQDLDHWTPLAAETFAEMFYGARRFNGKIGNWFGPQTKSIRRMFYQAEIFDQPLNHLDTSSIEDFSEAFYNAKSFNQPLDSWDVSSSTTLKGLFGRTTYFNQPLGSWSVGHLPRAALEGFLENNSVYRQDLSTWDVEHITSEPTKFADSNPQWLVSQRPLWGVKPALVVFIHSDTTDTEEGLNADGPIVYRWESDTHWTAADDGVVRRTMGVTPGKLMRLYYKAKAIANPLTVSYTKYLNEIVSLSNFHKHFIAKDSKLSKVPVDLPSSITSLEDSFNNCYLFTQDISNWAVNQVTSLARTFKRCAGFNVDLSNWKIANVTSLHETFYSCTSLTTVPSGNDWSTANVTDLTRCFYNTKADYSGLSLWDTSNVVDMTGLFERASGTNIQSIQQWNVRKVERMDQMFRSSTLQVDLSAWATIKLQEPSEFTSNAQWPIYEKPYWGPMVSVKVRRHTGTPLVMIEAEGGGGPKWLATDHPDFPLAMVEDLNQPFIQMTGSQVPTTGMTVYARLGYDPLQNYARSRPFRLIATGSVDAITFEEGILSGFAVNNSQFLSEVPAVLPRSITTLHDAFSGCVNFNLPAVSNWDTSNVTNLDGTFKGCKAFNQPLANWQTSKVTSLRETFSGAEAFNQPLNGWDVRLVRSFARTFQGAKVFNQDLDQWLWTLGDDFTGFLEGALVFNGLLPMYHPKRLDKLEAFLKNARAFSRSLAHWPTAVFTKPTDFDTSTNAWATQNKPVWGTENLLDGNVSVFAVYNGNANPAVVMINGYGMNAYWLDEGPATDNQIDATRSIPGRTVRYLVSRADGATQSSFKFQSTELTAGSYVSALQFYENVTQFSFNLPEVELYVPIHLPANVNTLEEAFMYSDRFNDPAVRWWDTTNVLSLKDAFNGCERFNQHVGWWRVNNVTNMDRAFQDARVFNRDLRAWYVFQFSSPPVDFVKGATAFNPDYLPNFGFLPDVLEPIDYN